MSRSATIAGRGFSFRLVAGDDGYEIDAERESLRSMATTVTARLHDSGVPGGDEPDPLAALAGALAGELGGEVVALDPMPDEGEEGEDIVY